MAPLSFSAEYIVLQSPEVQAKVARLRADTRKLKAEIGRFAAINGHIIEAGGDPHNLPNPWYLTPARLDTILRLYYGLEPHDRAVAALYFGQYFGSVNGVANGVPINVVVVNDFTIYARVASHDEVFHMINCIEHSESFGEGGTSLPVHSEEELKFDIIIRLTLRSPASA